MANKFEIDFLEDYSKNSLIKELRRIQKIVGEKPVTKRDIEKYGKAGWTTYFKKFGSFSKALLEAGLQTSKRMNTTNDELIGVIIELWTKTLEKEGRRPYTSDLKKYGLPYCQDTYRRRFGTWKKALILAYNSIDNKSIRCKEVGKSKTREKNQIKSARKEISVRQRFLVFKRDHFTCAMCGRSGLGVRLELDHKIPLSKGGTNNVSNLQTLCFDCNRGKRNDFE